MKIHHNNKNYKEYSCFALIFGGFTRYDSKLDFDCKSIPKLESNSKVTKKPCEITANPL